MSELSERDRTIIESIIGYCDSIASRLERYGIDEEVFTRNDDYREMVLFPLLQIGESANHLSAGFLGLPGGYRDAIMTEVVQVSESSLKTAGRGEERGRMPGLEIYHLGGGLSL